MKTAGAAVESATLLQLLLRAVASGSPACHLLAGWSTLIQAA